MERPAQTLLGHRPVSQQQHITGYLLSVKKKIKINLKGKKKAILKILECRFQLPVFSVIVLACRLPLW
uniref:Uncharacterized protein n=1 Tax=Anguilla anguilla TaxID=7936 RepID=A0A0E9WHD6_ANGAN